MKKRIEKELIKLGPTEIITADDITGDHSVVMKTIKKSCMKN